jgi:preprotein translocase subunit SecY
MLADIIGMDGAIVLVLVLVPLAVIVWGITDAAQRPAWAWDQAHRNRTIWIALQALAVLFFFVGFILTLVYLTTIRREVAAAQASGRQVAPTI